MSEWLYQNQMVARVQELTGSVTKSIRVVVDGEFKNGKPKYRAEFLSPIGETIYHGVCAKRGMYMIGCRATPQERSKIFEMWKIGTAAADLQSALTTATPLNIPLFHVAPFYRVENFLIANHLNGKPQYQIDYAPYTRVINAGGGTVSTAPAPSFGSTTHAVQL
ncbi:hypothetical protein PAPYR_11962 [Paratrimastix pyriformis]|uniref:Uncharacterized protein n=1 Tax=Paratrimastix pyriformis TaxID=342808 RepID=A0ABQ8U7H9_9EUKA|nr:hypothetical protein PAPYR_11962 [Paratrimastix pyriformis]